MKYTHWNCLKSSNRYKTCDVVEMEKYLFFMRQKRDRKRTTQVINGCVSLTQRKICALFQNKSTEAIRNTLWNCLFCENISPSLLLRLVERLKSSFWGGIFQRLKSYRTVTSQKVDIDSMPFILGADDVYIFEPIIFIAIVIAVWLSL